MHSSSNLYYRSFSCYGQRSKSQGPLSLDKTTYRRYSHFLRKDVFASACIYVSCCHVCYNPRGYSQAKLTFLRYLHENAYQGTATWQIPFSKEATVEIQAYASAT